MLLILRTMLAVADRLLLRLRARVDVVAIKATAFDSDGAIRATEVDTCVALAISVASEVANV